MPNPSDDSAVDVRARYAAQFGADLERNRDEQQQIHDQVAKLTERLALLKSEEVLLADLSGRVTTERETAEEPTAAEPTGSEPDAPSEVSGDTAVPRPRKRRPSRGGAVGVKTETKDSATTAARRPKGGQSVGADKVAEKPTLRAAVLQLLRQHHEPRTVKEVAEELTRVHPHLTPAVGVVRDALSAHVSKSLVEREKKQGAVWYTATEPEPSVESGVSEEAVTANA